MKNHKPNKENFTFHIPKEGSLGLLAYGDIGLTEWRKVINASKHNEEEK